MPTSMNEQTVSNKRQYFCHGCGQPIKFDANFTSPKSGKAIPLNMNGEQHDCPNFNNKANNNQERQNKSDISSLSSEQIKFVDTLISAIAEIHLLSKDTNKKVVEMHEVFLKSKGDLRTANNQTGNAVNG
jgi:hypothetical protein